jgi:hypothetical protein
MVYKIYVQIENPSDEELQLGIDASINEDVFDLDDLSEEERGGARRRPG